MSARPDDRARCGPVRRCVGCGRRRSAADLVRVHRVEGAEFVTATHGPGRGAWLCPEPACLERARRRRGFERALGAPLGEATWAELERRVG